MFRLDKLLPVLAAMVASPLLAACDAPRDEGELLFELREDEIRDAVDRYAPEADADAVVAQMQAPFDCTRFGAACDTLGEQGAYDALESVWMAALDGVDDETLLATIEWQPAPTYAPRSTAPGPIGPFFGPVSASASDLDFCMVSPFINEFLSLDVSVSDLGLLVIGSASFDATRTVWDLFYSSGPRINDYTLRGSLTTSGGTTLGSRIVLFPSASSGSTSIVSFSSAAGFDMWALVDDSGGACGGLSAEATASL